MNSEKDFKMKEYHILSLSGGKDSTALAFFMKENMPEIFEKMEMVFCDTEKEIPETYDYLNKIEIFLDKKIIRLKPYRSFDHLMSIYNHLPSVQQRWCTIEMKTKVFRKYVFDLFKEQGEGVVRMYIGIRADEADRTQSSINNDNFINAIYPFVENGVNKSDVENILIKSGIGYPDYYKWRKRSGCYFCMYQSKNDWLNLYENHPDLFQKAMEYEIEKGATSRQTRFGWNCDMALKDMIKPENMKKIRENYANLQERRKAKALENKENSGLLYDIDSFDENQCRFCHL